MVGSLAFVRDALGFVGAACARTLAALADLVLPADCAGCGAAAGPNGGVGDGGVGAGAGFGSGAAPGVCAECARSLRGPPGATRPTPAPEGLPPCFAGGVYAGPLRELILAYKERGRRDLAAPLGDSLAVVVRTGAWVRAVAPRLLVVPVPATAAAARARRGDHMLSLARRAAVRLRREGWPVGVASPLRALPKVDSAQLGRHARAAAAREAFVARPADIRALRATVPTASVVLLDDVVTTGATLAAVAGRLADEGIDVAFSATLAATQLRLHPA